MYPDSTITERKEIIMKKLISLILALALCCMLVPAMAEEDITGEWYASFAGIAMTMTINADGTLSMTAPGQEGSAEGIWTLEGDQLTLTVDESPATATVSADGILLSSGGMDMLFTREPVEVPTVGEVKPDAAAEEFYGEWAVAYMEAEGILMDPGAVGMGLPKIVLGEGTIEFIATDETDFMTPIFNALGLVSAYENGALNLTSTTEGITATGKVEMLTDGMIKVSLDNNGNAMVFYYKPAATAEEPAA